MRILFIGDVVGRPGRSILQEQLPRLRARWRLNAVVVNGENAAGGFGITEEIFTDFLDAVRSGKNETAVPFEYGTRLTEFSLLGNLAMKAGQGRKVLWDGPNMKVTNLPELNAWVHRPARDGWKA